MQKMQAIRLQDVKTASWHEYDPWLVLVVIFLLVAGVVMVASSSVALAERLHQDPFYYLQRQALALLTGLVVGAVILKSPVTMWEKLGTPLLLLAILLLVLVLIPGIGREVNGSARWIRLGPVNFQSSELAKVCIITYIAAYLVRHAGHLHLTFTGFIRPIAVITLISGLLLLEPDYGTVVVIFLTTIGMLFMAGSGKQVFIWVPVITTALAAARYLLAVSPGRLEGFMNPWDDPFNSGYQLTQSLIAFGRGEWFGVGLGSSVQKLFYLTQAHTDFIFAITAEELGLLFTLLVTLAFFVFIWRVFSIAGVAHQLGKHFAAYMAYGIGLIIGIQAFIHMGVNVGLLPTKGLTLPLFSYGANSIVFQLLLVRDPVAHRPGKPLSRGVRIHRRCQTVK